MSDQSIDIVECVLFFGNVSIEISSQKDVIMKGKTKITRITYL